MASTAPAPPKKTVLHQQLYGSKKFARPQHNQPYRNIEDHYEIPTMNSYRNQHAHCPIRQSQSITTLNRLRSCGSYTALPRTTVCDIHDPENINSSRWYVDPSESLCYLNNAQQRPTPQCTCDTSTYLQRGKQHHYQDLTNLPQPFVHGNPKPQANGYYFGYDNASHVTDEDSAFPGLPERELNLLHRNVPALRRTGLDTAGMRQYFYPDGGWGWIICGLAFLAHLLTSGLQFSYGLLMVYIMQHLQNTHAFIESLGALSLFTSMIVTPFVITICRKKSTRLVAVVGGLMLPLSILFTSFATEFGQIVFSFGILFGISATMVRVSSAMMLGTYFSRRRKFVEMMAMSGEGVGIALYSVLLKEGVGGAGWRPGLQYIAGPLTLCFLMATLYRSASLYHPQRGNLQYLKIQQRKMFRDDKTTSNNQKQKKNTFLLLDYTSLKSANVRILLLAKGVAALGIYAPMYTIPLSAEKEVSDITTLLAFIGISYSSGVALAGLLVHYPFRIGRLMINTQIVSQVFIMLIAIAILCLSFLTGFQGLCVLSWIYGMSLAGFRYSIKMLALERIKPKQFSKAWGFIEGIKSIPVLVSVPLTTFLNDYSLKYGRAGYYICSAAAAIAGIIIFFINHSTMQQNGSNTQAAAANRRCENGFISTLCPPPAPVKLDARYKQFYNYNDVEHDFSGLDGVSRSCISLNNVEGRNYNTQSSPVCCRVQLQCFRNMPFSEIGHPFERNNRRRRTIDCGVGRQDPLASSQYISGHGSVGSRMGRHIQRNLRSQYSCRQYQVCTCRQRASIRCLHQNPNFEMATLQCTCDSAYQMQHYRSLSVPEGLSTISQHCACKVPSILPQTDKLPQSARFCTGQEIHCHQYGAPICNVAHRPAYHIQTPDSLANKPLHYVEQMTTSV